MLVELSKFYNSLEAGVVQSRLEADGVTSFLFDVEMNWGGLDGVVPIRLMVDDSDLADARRILAEES